MEILQLADQCGVVAVTKHEWDGKRFNHTDECLDGDAAALVIFAKLVAQHEREACIVDIQMHIPRSGRHTPEYQMAMRMIERIRARGQA
jgi:hypothetical protein